MRPYHILCFGDSLTEGWINRGKDFKPYTNRLQTLFDKQDKEKYTVINEGLSSEPVRKEMYLRLSKVLRRYEKIDLLILQGGTNDILLYNEPNIFNDFLKLFQVLKFSGNVKKVCLLNIMEGYFTEADDAIMSHEKSNKIRLSTNQMLADYAEKEEKFYFCDIAKKFPMFSLNDAEKNKYWDDLIHPSTQGYEKMAEIIYDCFIENN